jgi:hypothetical protein
VKTFIHVSHTLIARIYFTVWGEDDEGKPMTRPGPGGLRVMQFQRSIIVPSVRLPLHTDTGLTSLVCARPGCRQLTNMYALSLSPLSPQLS